MPTTSGQVDIVNQALALLGVAPIGDMDDQDSVTAAQAKLWWPQSLAVVGRAAPWNCLLKPAVLVQEVQEPIDPQEAQPASTEWAPATNYAVGAYVTFGNPAYLYYCLVANLSTASFTNDLTAGYWQQTDIVDPNAFGPQDGYQYPSGWAYKYKLPDDFLLIVELNNRYCIDYKETFQVMGRSLYTNDTEAVIKYTWPDPDTTIYDPMFVEVLVLKLAASMATKLRQDDTRIAGAMESAFMTKLRAARTKNANEGRKRRFVPQANSRWISSRTWSTNG